MWLSRLAFPAKINLPVGAFQKFGRGEIDSVRNWYLSEVKDCFILASGFWQGFPKDLESERKILEYLLNTAAHCAVHSQM